MFSTVPNLQAYSWGAMLLTQTVREARVPSPVFHIPREGAAALSVVCFNELIEGDVWKKKTLAAKSELLVSKHSVLDL